MKKLMVATLAMAAFAAMAAEKKDAEKAELAKNEAPVFWGFGSSGIYSGYQLYGSCVNSEPTWQTYLEGNANLLIKDFDLGYLGIGIWSNSDLTDRRRSCNLGRMWNEWDFNVHWGKTFWIDDDRTWGLDYRTSVVWYYYPGKNYHGGNSPNNLTMDWNHSFALKNPYVVPFIDVVHEYHESDGNLLQFGLKRDFVGAFDVEGLTLTPSATFVWRNRNYGWCFPHYGLDENFSKINSCLATMKLMLEGTYQFSDHFGVFAKIAFCQIIDGDLREACEACDYADYGKYKEFVWGGVGLTFNF